MSTTQKDYNLLILSEDATSLDFGTPEELEKKENTDLEDDFAFTIEEDDSSLEIKEDSTILEDNSTKNSLSDLMLDLTSKSDENTLDKKDSSEFDSINPLEDEDLNLDGFNISIDNNNLSSESEYKEVDEQKVIEEEKNKVLENNFSEEIIEKKDEELTLASSSNSKNVGDMAEILDRTISEFTQREVLITEDITEREKHISDLENKLNTEKEILTGLESEKSAIEKNRKSLEKMKTDFENREEVKTSSSKKNS